MVLSDRYHFPLVICSNNFVTCTGSMTLPLLQRMWLPITLTFENALLHFRGLRTHYGRAVHVYCGQTAEWIRIPRGTQIGLGPGDIVLDGDPAPHGKGNSSPPPLFVLLYVPLRPSYQSLSSCYSYLEYLQILDSDLTIVQPARLSVNGIGVTLRWTQLVYEMD